MKTIHVILFSTLFVLLLASSGLAMSCVDSDGEDIMSKGYVEGNWFSNGDDGRHTDVCFGHEYVYEMICSEGAGRYEKISCPSGTECQQGACVDIEKETFVACSETDNGYDQETKGHTMGTYLITGVFQEAEDFCDGQGKLGEFYCNDQGYMYVYYESPPEGYLCENGAFVSSQNYELDEDDKKPVDEGSPEAIPSSEEGSVGGVKEDHEEEEYDNDPHEQADDLLEEIHICTDSDKGVDEFRTGVTESKNTVTHEGGNIEIIFDEKKDSCSDSEDYDIDEYFCDGSQIASKKITCQQGFSCEDGSCVESFVQEEVEEKGTEEVNFEEHESTEESKEEFTSADEIKKEILEAEASCDFGCMIEESCVPIGYRVAETYCTIGRQMEAQLEVGSSCSNNFECSTNSCVSSECRDLVQELEEANSLIEQLLETLAKLFRLQN